MTEFAIRGERRKRKKDEKVKGKEKMDWLLTISMSCVSFNDKLITNFME